MTTLPRGGHRAPRACLLLAFLLASAFSARAAKPNWKPVTPAELAETEPHISKEAAEAVFVQVEVDDRDFPSERRITEYIRYKIFAPERAEHITRISGFESTTSVAQSRTELRARLMLPDGRTEEFGQEAIKERTVSRKAKEGGFLGWLSGSGDEVKEKFLAVSGVESGAVLEYQITRRQTNPSWVTPFIAQREGVPVRALSYAFRPCPETAQWDNRLFVSNRHGAELKSDTKARIVTVTAADLPAVVHEPFLGPLTDYALTIFFCYQAYNTLLIPRSERVPTPGTIEAKLGPWAPHATLMNWFERDRGYPTNRVKQLVKEITADAADDAAKALAIHVYTQNLYQSYRRRPGPRPTTREQPKSLDDILDWEKKPEINRPAEEFFWLAMALYRSAGLDCRMVLLPDRRLARFNPQNVSSAFLQFKAAAIRLGEEWRFSVPHTTNRIPFGMLPWENEASVGLVALEKKEEFMKVSAAPPDKSVIATTGKFRLDGDGTLTGEFTRGFTGHTAIVLRGQLRATTLATRRNQILRAQLGLDEAAVITGTEFHGLDDAEKPLVATCRLRWPGFAARVGDRLVVKPSVFRCEAGSPFTSAERRHPVHFHYRWQEFDRVELQVPPGYEPEAPNAPAPSKSEVLNCETKISYEHAKRTLHLSREFTSHLLDLPAEQYPALKAWYDRVARADQHEIVFHRSADAGPETPATKPAKKTVPKKGTTPAAAEPPGKAPAKATETSTRN